MRGKSRKGDQFMMILTLDEKPISGDLGRGEFILVPHGKIEGGWIKMETDTVAWDGRSRAFNTKLDIGASLKLNPKTQYWEVDYTIGSLSQSEEEKFQ